VEKIDGFPQPVFQSHFSLKSAEIKGLGHQIDMNFVGIYGHWTDLGLNKIAAGL
jgi:hypothetical protein